jgi:BirA family biotin operon repressor/biotin-[acetyl-CoA-carboxylase] ligase
VSSGGASSGGAEACFDVARFRELRQGCGLGWGAPLIHSPSTGSTNDDALAAARSGGANGSVFVADHQTHGRGRRGKTWVAAPGQHLLFSILLRDVQPRKDDAVLRDSASPGVGALTLAVGLGVREALAAHTGAGLGVPLRLKWPNDVLAGWRKLAGILCEGQFVGSRLEAVVIGIGINVCRASYPPELEAQVACLEGLAASGAVLERERLLVEVLAAVESRVAVYQNAGFAALLDEFTRHDALAGHSVVVGGATPIAGVARGVDAGGRLLVESDGLIVPVIAGTVRAAALKGRAT